MELQVDLQFSTPNAMESYLHVQGTFQLVKDKGRSGFPLNFDEKIV